MAKRILTIIGILAVLVVASDGYLHNWLGTGPLFGKRASIIGAGSRVDVRAVEAWASVEAAAKLCGLKVTEAAGALKRVDWNDDPVARRTIAQVNKRSREQDKDQFCQDVWTAYGPSGRVISGLVQKPEA